jgi:hypothetical protein
MGTTAKSDLLAFLNSGYDESDNGARC